MTFQTSHILIEKDFFKTLVIQHLYGMDPQDN